MDKKEFLKGWKTEKVLGRGTFGTVYEISRVNEDGLTEKSALKVINIPKNDEELIEYQTMYTDAELPVFFETQKNDAIEEFETMQIFSNDKHIVSFFEHAVSKKEDGQGWTAVARMELLTPLTTYLKTHSLKEKDIVNIGIDMCSGLETLNGKGVVHRDIKHQNIFIDNDHNFKLGDFGTARSLDHTTMATKKGTIGFMAPEVYNNAPCNQTLDYYSVGLVLYWLLNERRLPFLPLPPAVPTARDNETAIARRMGGEKAPEPKFGCDRLKKVIAKAIEFDPEKRYKTATEMKFDLFEILQKENLDTVVLGLNGAVAKSSSTESNIKKTIVESETTASLEIGNDVEATINDTLTIFERTEKQTDTVSEDIFIEGKTEAASGVEASVPEDTMNETLSVFGNADKQTDNSIEESDMEKTVSVFDSKNNTIKEEPKPKKKSKIGILAGVIALVLVVVAGIGIFKPADNQTPNVPEIIEQADNQTSNNPGKTESADIYWGISDDYTLYLSSSVLSEKESSNGAGKLISFGQTWAHKNSLISKVIVKDEIKPVGKLNFDGFENCTSMNLKLLNTEYLTDMSSMFQGCSALEELDLSSFNTKNVEDMTSMFLNCIRLKKLDISSFDTSNVVYMGDMFGATYELRDLDVTKFDTSKVERMGYMFSGYRGSQLDVSNFNTSNVRDMYGMFCGCRNLRDLDVGNFDTTKVTAMFNMFYGCEKLEKLDLSSFNTSCVTNMESMFERCRSLKKLDLSHFDMSNVTNVDNIFKDTSLTAASTGLKM